MLTDKQQNQLLLLKQAFYRELKDIAGSQIIGQHSFVSMAERLEQAGKKYKAALKALRAGKEVTPWLG